MNSQHARPLLAFALVALLCAATVTVRVGGERTTVAGVPLSVFDPVPRFLDAAGAIEHRVLEPRRVQTGHTLRPRAESHPPQTPGPADEDASGLLRPHGTETSPLPPVAPAPASGPGPGNNGGDGAVAGPGTSGLVDAPAGRHRTARASGGGAEALAERGPQRRAHRPRSATQAQRQVQAHRERDSQHGRKHQQHGRHAHGHQQLRQHHQHSRHVRHDTRAHPSSRKAHAHAVATGNRSRASVTGHGSSHGSSHGSGHKPGKAHSHATPDRKGLHAHGQRAQRPNRHSSHSSRGHHSSHRHGHHGHGRH